jgi:hypothetical protein
MHVGAPPSSDSIQASTLADQALNRGGLLGLVDALWIVATGDQASLSAVNAEPR